MSAQTVLQNVRCPKYEFGEPRYVANHLPRISGVRHYLGRIDGIDTYLIFAGYMIAAIYVSADGTTLQSNWQDNDPEYMRDHLANNYKQLHIPAQAVVDWCKELGVLPKGPIPDILNGIEPTT